MSLIRWRQTRPFDLLDEVERTMAQLLPRRWWPEAQEYELVPAVDVYETNDEVVVKAELPGIDKKDVDVTATEDRIVLSGETTSTEEVDEDNYYRREMRYGSFRRSIPLPHAVDPDAVTAKFTNGVLEIRAPKAPEPAEGKKIEVK